METLKVNCKSKKWGWGYSTRPVQTETGLVIEEPSQPDYTGTVNQIRKAIRNDREYNSLGGAHHCDRWFYDGHRVKAYEWWFADDPDDPDGSGHFGFTADMREFDPESLGLMGETFKIKV